jgi:hypothetical protein
MSFEWYITPEHYDQARKNGISKDTLDYRVKNLVWDIQKAISTPPKVQKKTSLHWRQIAKRNRIPYQAFQKRVNIYGWDQERAATESLQDRQEAIVRARMAQIKKREVSVK